MPNFHLMNKFETIREYGNMQRCLSTHCGSLKTRSCFRLNISHSLFSTLFSRLEEVDICNDLHSRKSEISRKHITSQAPQCTAPIHGFIYIHIAGLKSLRAFYTHGAN
jgi:hypothetical protein